MKKLLIMFVAALCTISAFAGKIEVKDGIENGAYIEGALQVGATSKLNVYIVAEKTIESALQADIYLPEGFTAESGESTIEGYALTFTPHPELGNCVRLIWANTSVGTINAKTPVLAAKISVTTANTVAVGTYSAYVNNLDFAGSYNNEEDSYYNDIKVQKTAVIEPQDPNYAFEIIPFAINAGESKNIPLSLKSNGSDVCYFSCKVTYPSGITNAYTAGRGGAKVMTKATLNTDNLYTTVSADEAKEWGVETMTLSQTIAADGSNAVYIVNSETNATFDTFVATKDYKSIINIPVMADKDLADGVYTLKISDISITTFDGTNPSTEYVGGEYLASVFVGEPITDAILYGHYTTEGKAAAAAMKGGSADITAATVDGELSINDVLIMGKDKTSYARTVGASDYATICLPFAIAGELYTVKEISETSITLAEATEVAANTPAIIKGNINFSKEGYVAPEAPVAGANGLTGTYKYIDKVTGYYLAGNKFYNDYADVKPFRAYIPAPATAKPLSILVETANGIIDITDQLSAEDIYSLQGIKMNKAQKGVNIVGGKKIYVK